MTLGDDEGRGLVGDNRIAPRRVLEVDERMVQGGPVQSDWQSVQVAEVDLPDGVSLVSILVVIIVDVDAVIG